MCFVSDSQIDSVEEQDGGSYQCQVPMETEAEVISSTPVEVSLLMSFKTNKNFVFCWKFSR